MSTQITTPDQRYIIVRGRLWRSADPSLRPERRARLVAQLMDARRAVAAANRAARRGTPDPAALAAARAAVETAKQALGERGPVWWSDGSPDLNRRLVRNTPYAAWYAGLSDEEPESR
ncbi:MAG: hypothetical protein INR70_33090 [Parafilimonas terrae]|nr:hypothetical protein [Parafilimonas terrae]